MSRIKWAAEPPVQRWVNDVPVRDDARTVAHLMTLLSACVVIYAGVTRGALLVARVLARVAG
jgi:hypothetical protein